MPRFPAALAAAVLALPLAGCRGADAPARLSYEVRLEPGAAIAVEARWSGLADDHTLVLPRARPAGARPGAPAAFDTAGAALPVDRLGEGRGWRVRHPGRDAVVLRWSVDGEDPEGSAEATFVDRERAVVAGDAVFLVPGGTAPPGSRIDVSVRAPAGWSSWATWPGDEGRFRPASASGLVGGFLAAGAFTERRMAAEGTSVRVLTEGRGGVHGLSVANRLTPVLREMVALFGAPPRGDRFEVLALYRTKPVRDRRSQLRGVRRAGGFLCLSTRDRAGDLEELTAVAAHECLHAYLGGAIAVAAEPPHANAPELIWFTEGLTEYLAHRLLRDAGVVTPGGFEAVVGRFREAASRAPAIPLAEAARRVGEAAVYTTVYPRGFLIGLEMDRRASEACGAGSLDRALRDLFEEARERPGSLFDEETIASALDHRCPAMMDAVREGSGGNVGAFAAGR